MRAEASGRPCAADRNDAVDGRPRLLATLTFVLIAVVTPIRWWPAYFIEAAIVLAAYASAGQPWRLLVVRLGAVFPLLLLVAGSVVLSQVLRDGWLLAIQILARATLALTAMITLTVTTPFPSILTALARLRVPATLVAVLTFMYRFTFVLADDLVRMRRAVRARTFRDRPIAQIQRVARLVGLLLLRAFERAERVYAAMCARGWNGTLPDLDNDA